MLLGTLVFQSQETAQAKEEVLRVCMRASKYPAGNKMPGFLFEGSLDLWVVPEGSPFLSTPVLLLCTLEGSRSPMSGHGHLLIGVMRVAQLLSSESVDTWPQLRSLSQNSHDNYKCSTQYPVTFRKGE